MASENKGGPIRQAAFDRVAQLYGETGGEAGTKDAFDRIARKTKVPANLLIAMDEAAGGKLDTRAAEANAARIAAAMSEGRAMEEAVADLAGEAAPQLIDRAYQIADELYPAPAAPEAVDPRADGRVSMGEAAGGAGRSLTAGAVGGAGSMIEALGQTADEALRFGRDPNMPDGPTFARGLGRSVGGAVRDAGEAVREGASEDYKTRVAGTAPGGNLIDPSSWTLGEDPSILGLIDVAAQGLGSMAPMVLAPNAKVAAVMGGLMGGGEGAENGRKFVEDAARTLGEDGQPEIAKLPEYQTLIAGGADHAAAVAELTRSAENNAGFRQAVFAGLGGAATNRIMRSADGWLGQGGRLTRAVKKAGAGGLEEGVQEAAEGAASGLGIEAATGADLNVMQDSFGDFVGGALAGGAMGGAAGALGRGARPETAEPTPPEAAAPLGLPAPRPDLPGPSGARPARGLPSLVTGQPPAPAAPADPGGQPIIDAEFTDIPPPAGPAPAAPAPMLEAPAAPAAPALSAPMVPAGGSSAEPVAAPVLPSMGAAAPAGPVASIADELAATLPAPEPEAPARFPDMKPGKTLDLGAEPGRNVTAVAMGETEDGIVVRVDGTERTMTPEQFDAARDLAKVNAEAAKAAAKTGKQADVEPDRAADLVAPSGGPAPGLGDGRAPGGEGAAPGRPPVQEGAAAVAGLPGQPDAQAVAEAGGGDLGRLDVAAQPGKLDAALSEARTRGEVQHVTAKGKTKTGFLLQGVTKAEADRIDPYSFKKDGGFFVNADRAGAFVVQKPAQGDTQAGLTGTDAPQIEPADNANPAAEMPDNAESGGSVPSATQPRSLTPQQMRDDLATRYDGNAKTQADDLKAEAKSTLDAGGRVFVNVEGKDREIVLVDNLGMKDKNGNPWGITALMMVTQADMDKPALRFEPASTAPGAVATAAADVAAAPTDAQKEAGNYKKGHARWNGLDLSIETAKGQDRTGTDPNGRAWSVTMPADYGYIRRTEGADGDHVDFYMGPDEASDAVFVIDQFDADTGAFDEHKALLGFPGVTQARAAYEAGFSDGRAKERMGGIRQMTADEFKTWVKDGDTKSPASRGGKERAAKAAPDEGTPAKAPTTSTEKPAKAASTAPEHAAVGVDPRELSEIVTEFNDAASSMRDGESQIHHLFDAPPKDDIVRLGRKAGVRQATKDGMRVYHRDAGWMTPDEARERIEAWKAHARAQGETRENAQKVVLSLFDLTGSWSRPWEEAGYQVYRFDIQADPEMGDVNNFSTDFFGDWFGDFDGMDIHAILAACPCTDFASSGSRHFAAKDEDGRTVASVKLVHQTLATIEHFRPAVWAIENPVGRIENLGGLPPWRLSFEPFHLGDTYTKATLLWGRFNGDLPVAPVEPVEGSKMHSKYGGKSLATKNARSATPEGFAYGFFMANNAIDHPVMALHGKFDRLDRALIEEALDRGITPEAITEAVADLYYMELDDDAANQAIRDLIDPPADPEAAPVEDAEIVEETPATVRNGATADSLNAALDRGATVIVKTPLRETPIKARVRDQWRAAGHEFFKQAADGSLLMIEGTSKGKPRYANASLASIRVTGGMRAEQAAEVVEETPAKRPAVEANRDTLRITPAPSVDPAPFAAAIGTKANRPMQGLDKLDFDAFDDKTREDGQNSPAKRAGRDETGRWAKAVVKGLREVAGMEPVTDKKGKAQVPVKFGWGMASELDETSITLAGRNGIQAYVKIGNALSRGQTLNIMVKITGNPEKPGYSRAFIGGNTYIPETATPAEAAAQIDRLVTRAQNAAEKPADQEAIKSATPATAAPEAPKPAVDQEPIKKAAPLDPQPRGPRRFDWWWTNNRDQHKQALENAGITIPGGAGMGQREIFDKMTPDQFAALQLAIFGPEAEAAPAKPARKSAKAQAAEQRAAYADYFTPGNVVRSYGGGFDRVVSFDPEARSVTVESVIRQGDGWSLDPAAPAPRRTHFTMPEARQLREGPVYRAAPAVQQTQAEAETDVTKTPPQSGPENVTRPADPAPEAPAPAGILGVLSDDKQKRGAELKAKLAALARNSASSGLNPEYITLGGELVGLYIEAGVTRFGQMLRDFARDTGLSMKEAQAPMRAAYNHVRDDMDLNGEDISQFDGAEAVMAEVRKAIKAEATAAAADENPAPGQIPAKTIRADVAVTARGREIPVRYALVEMDSLIPSQTDEGRANPAYDKRLQPRDRSGNKSAEQVRQIAQKLNPALLGESPMASTGAPIILPTGEVLSGNGRTLALRQAPAERMGEYRAFLKAQGYPEGDMSRPVLVRIADGMSMEDAAAFAREANERDTADMSVSEQAMVDAEGVTPAMLDLYRGGDVDAAANAEFVRAFGKDVMAANDAGRMRDNEGRMTQDAVRRINGALLAKAYGDPGIVAAILESTDTNIKSIGGALTDVAPIWAQMRAAVERGTIAADADRTADLVEAVKLVDRARREGRPLSEFLNQTDMFAGESVSPGGVAFLGMLYRDTGPQAFKRPYGRDKVADALSFYAGEALKTTPGVDLLGERADTGTILTAAKGRINDQQDAGQDLFGQRTDPGSNPAPAGTAGDGPAVQEGQAGLRGSGGSRDQAQGGLNDGLGGDDQGLRPGSVAGSGPEAADGGGSAAGDGPGGEVGGSGLSDQDGAGNLLAAGMEPDRTGRAGDASGERKGQSPGNFVIPADFPLGEGTPGQKIEANMAALRLVKQLDAENRYATPAEQQVLARYVGWGGLKRVFDPRETGKTGQFGRAQAELREILTPREYRAAGASTENAHYTSRTVVNAMWQKMREFGFDGGRALEPTIGSGNFVGLQPADLSGRTEWFAAELDNVTGRIATHLYPDATIFDGMGFQNAPFRPGSIDVAIGNPPFSSDPISSKRHPEIPTLSLHNYIIAKTGLLLRPGGIMGVVVTNRFLDAPNPQARDYLARHFNFMGAVRLPNTAFKGNAGTEVTTDIVWFQKRDEGEPAGDLSWLDTGVRLGEVEVNGYFAKNPQMMLGRPGMDGTMYGGKQEFTLHDDGRDLGAALAEALGRIEGALNARTEALEAAVVADKPTSAMAIGEMQMLGDGRVMIRRDDDAEGAPVIEQITADSPWGSLAFERRAVMEAADAARTAIKGNTPEEQAAAIAAFKEAVAQADVFNLDGSRKAKPTQVAAAIYRIADGLMDANPFFGKAQETALKELRGLVEKQVLGPKKLDTMKGLLGLRRDAQALLRAEHENNPDMERMRKALAARYRAFVKDNGFISSRANDALIGGVPGIEAALETGYKPADAKRGTKETAKEAAILRKRIITPYAQIRSAKTAADGVHASLRERGRLDLGFIASLTGSNIEAVTAELTAGEKPQAFFDPARSEYVIADEYLSGNLAEKIEQARADGRFDNVKALEAAMPAPKEARQITPSIRSMWIPAEIFNDFLRELGARNPKTKIDRAIGMIEADPGPAAAASDFGKTFQTERRTVFEIFKAAVKGKSITVTDTTADRRQVKNEQETTNANAAADRLGAEFQKWAYLNPERQRKIVDAFNTTMNVVVPRKFDGVSYLTQVGANPEIQMRNSQKNGAWRMMLSDSTLLHHVVGAGKTFTAITAIMERKRLGLSRKSLVVVPNHLVSQWARDFYALYPGANILAASEKDFSAKNRRKLIARMATGDYDAIIIGHSQLKNLENDPQKVRALIEEQVAALQESLEEAKRSGENRATVAQIQKRITKYEEKLEALTEAADKADSLGFTFNQTGIDNLVIDEAQEFKNLEYSTAADRLVGMNSPTGSQRALDLYIKTRSLLDSKQAVGFLTGTPVSNSLVEIYTVMKYLAPGTLRDMGLMHYDSWASSFVQSKVRFEYTAAQKLKERNVLSGLVNLGPLSDLYRSFADIVMRPDVERMYREQMEAENAANGTNRSTRFPTPKVRGGGRQLVSIPASEQHKEFTDYLVLRMDGIKRNASDKDYPKRDNALWVLSDARKASIDIRTVDPTAQRSLQSKVVTSGDKILKIARDTAAVKGTQMVFADSSVPLKNASKDIEKALKGAWEKAGLSKGDIASRMERDKRQGKPYAQQWGEAVEAMEDRMASGDLTAAQMDALEEWMNGEDAGEGAGNALTADTGFSFYDDLKAYLVENGMKAEQIAFIHDYNTAAQKSALFEAVNGGDVRVLIGSTFKMGAGTNAQQKLVALHHIDAPWRPSDMEQREGRIIRQGNELYEADPEGFEVDILAYTTEQTADVVMWQVLERKAAGIEQFLNATADTLIEDEGGDADSYATFMAQSTGNPIFLQKMEAEKAVRDMQAAQSSQRMIVNEARRFLEDAPRRAAQYRDRIAAAEVVTFDAFKDAGASHAAYQKAQADYDAARQAHTAEADAVRERNERLPKGEKREKLPEFDRKAPVMLDGDLDAYSAAIRKAIEQARDTGQADDIRLGGGAVLRIMSQDVVAGSKDEEGIKAYDAEIILGNGYSMDALPNSRPRGKNALALRSLVFPLMPDGIRDRLERATSYWKGEIEQIEKDTPGMEANAARQVDTKTLRAKERELEMLKGRTRVAEVAAARNRLGKVNRYAQMDIANAKPEKQRDLRSDQSDDAPLLPTVGDVFTFRQGDATLTAGFGAKALSRHRDAADKLHDQYWFEAVADDAERSLVLVQAAQIKETDGDIPRLTVIDTFETGITGASTPTKESRFDGLGGRAEGERITPEDARRINAAARAELDRVGILGRIRAEAGGEGRAAGTYGRGIIRIIRGRDGKWRHTLDHEILHALRDPEVWGGEAGLFSREEWSALARAARADEAIRARVEAAYPDLTEAGRTEEMVAEMYADWAQGRRQAPAGPIREALGRIRSFFRAAAAALRGEGFQDAARIMQRIADGEVGGRGPDGPGSGQGAPVREQRSMDGIRAAMSTGRARAAGMVSRDFWAKTPEVFSNWLTDAMGKNSRFNLLGAVPGQALFAELGRDLSAAQTYLRNKQEMDAERNAWQARASEAVDDWTRTARKDRDANARLMELMHDSTLAGIDPSKEDDWTHANAGTLARIEAKDRTTDTERALAERILQEMDDHKETYDRLRETFEALPPEFQALYSQIRDEYSALADETDKAVLENVQIAIDIAAKRARLDHAKELRRIRDEGLTGAAATQATEKADAALAQAKERASTGGRARLAAMRAAFEANRQKGPYFPLSRFGNYFVTVRDGEGAVVSFSRFEKKADQDAEVERATAEGATEGWTVSRGVLTDSADIRGAVDPAFISEVEKILAGTGASAATMDAVWQHWLETLPDMSVRKNKIHRKGRSGYNRDAVRAFSSAMFHGAHNLARLRYGLKMDDNLNDAEAQAARQPDPERAGFVVREMRQRHEFTMKPTNNPLVTAATSLAFVWYLGMSPAAAMVNISQTTVMGIPIMATRFKDAGVKGTSKALAKALGDFGQGRGWIEKSRNLTADEKLALQEAYRRGTIDRTQAHDLASVAESGVQYNPEREKVMKVVGFLFHHAERLNREVTFLAAYRLLKAEGKDAEAAVDEADALVKKIHFDYQNTSRPRMMQGDFTKVILSFRNFTVNALYRLFRDAHQSFAGASPALRREARGQLTGISLSMMAHAGIKGVWGYGLLMSLLGIFAGEDDDPEQWLQEVLLMEGDDMGTAAWNWGMGMLLNGVPGHVTGTSLTERIGMPNLWFRGPREGTEGQDVWAHYMGEIAGPVVGIGAKVTQGMSMLSDAWAEGNGENALRGAEKMVPSFAGNMILKPIRMGAYGANTYYGDPLMEVGPLDMLRTTLGFTPAELAERYEVNGKLKAREKSIMDRRARIHKLIGQAVTGGEAIPERVLEDLRAFNTEYPEYPITPETIRQSMGSRARAKSRNEYGVSLNPKLNDRIRSDMAPSVYN